MSRQVDVRENFYLVGYATTAPITPYIYNGLQLKGTTPGLLTIDGTVLPVAGTLLVKNQTNPIENGIYQVIDNGGGPNPFILNRINDTFGYDKGKPIYVLNGFTNQQSGWILNHSAEYIVVGVTPTIFLPLGNGSGPISSAKKIYTISQFKNIANKQIWTCIGEFQWNNLKYSSYTAGIVLTGTSVTGNNINIRLRDVTNNITLGQVLNVSTNGSISFSINNPTGDAVLQLQISRMGTGGTSPIIHGATLEYTS